MKSNYMKSAHIKIAKKPYMSYVRQLILISQAQQEEFELKVKLRNSLGGQNEKQLYEISRN